ncbi:MAG: phosphoribosylformylglycinamidine cyclo-ligase [Lentisphaerae bacterium]|nr:phosphoribosylformylglycinamidine cyclo-ligase [Lentisphaerota bacterium]
MKKSAYAKAGVNIDEKMAGLASVKRLIRGTFTSDVVGDIGSFGGLFESPGSENLLVASTDGVGTKLKVACMTGRHDTVGQDIVNHCVNDILVQGARPLFFLDYIGTSRLKAAILKDVVRGLCKACKENGCALLGGETAEMPGLYPGEEYDLVGTIVGTVRRRDVVTGANIKPGDFIVGLPSNGLHTNGYSLARKVIFEKAGLKTVDRLPGAGRSVADLLLAVHRSYLKPVTRIMRSVRVAGMAHITGGGFYDNIPRVLPENMMAVVERSAWTPPPLFRFIAERGNVTPEEMYRVFNMGIGYVLIVGRRDLAKTLSALLTARCPGKVIGRIERGQKSAVVTD